MEAPQITIAKPLTMKELRNEVWDYLTHDGNPDYLVFYFGNRVLKLPLKKMKAEARIFRHGYILGREDEKKDWKSCIEITIKEDENRSKNI